MPSIVRGTRAAGLGTESRIGWAVTIGHILFVGSHQCPAFSACLARYSQGPPSLGRCIVAREMP